MCIYIVCAYVLCIVCIQKNLQRGHCCLLAVCTEPCSGAIVRIMHISISVYTIHKEIIVMNILKVLFVIISLSGLLVCVSLGVAECLVDLF